MPPVNYIRQAFPEDWLEIQQARKTNERLDEICTDLESLSLDIENAGKGLEAMSDDLKTDFFKSIDALKEEVTNYLIEGKKHAQ